MKEQKLISTGRVWTFHQIAVAIIALTLSTPKTFAQEDFPPPPPDFGVSDEGSGVPAPPASGPRNGNGNSAPNAKDSGTLNKKSQNKFNRSGIEDITNENFPETIESFDFPNVEITDVIKAISELTGKNFIIDPGVRGKVTIIAPSKITVAEAYKAFLSALAITGYAVVPSGNFMKIKSARNAQRDSIETYAGAYYPNADQMITRIIHLKHISAEQVNRDLRILPSKDGEMSVYTPTNSIIFSDWGANIDRVMKIINQLDVPGFEEQLEVVPIRWAKAKDLADLIDKIVNKGAGNNRTGVGAQGGFASAVPRFNRPGGASSQQGASFFMAIPDDRTNSIIVVGNKSGILRVKKLISQLDFHIKMEDSGGVNVYYVKHGEAEKIAQVISGVAKDAGPKTTPGATPPGGFFPPLGGTPPDATTGGIFGGEVKVTADKNTNSLVITASKQDYDVVLNLLSKLDIPRDQVYVEAIIMEMTAGEGFQFKPGYYNFSGSGGIGRQGFNSLSPEEIINPLAGTGAVLGFASGGDVKIKVGATEQTVPSLVGLITLLKRTTRANILSQPQVIALDNQEATLTVGDRIATNFQQSTTAGGQVIRTPNMEDAPIELKLKPFINPSSESIRMETEISVKQPTNSAASAKAFQDETVPLATRKIKTNIVVYNGDTAVLGGLMKDRDLETVNKVPLLGDLPLIGWLFKSNDTQKEKVNMLVFLTPKIVRNPADGREVMKRKLNQRLGYIKSQGGVDPFGSTIDEVQNRGQAPQPDEKKME